MATTLATNKVNNIANANSAVDASIKNAAGHYILPHQQDEINRLRNQHEWLKATAGGRLIFAPVDKTRTGLKVLDSGTADGYWLKDVSSEFQADATFVGTDIAPHLFPPSYGPNFELVSHSITDELPSSWKNSFNLVHQRLVLPVLPPDEGIKAVSMLVSAVSPGGYIQLVEMDMSSTKDASVSKTPNTEIVRGLTNAILRASGMNPTSGRSLQEWLQKLKLVEIDSITIDSEVGATSNDPEVGERGIRNMIAVWENFKQAAALMPETLRQGLDLGKERLDNLGKEMENELREHGTFVRVHYVWGRKAGQ